MASTKREGGTGVADRQRDMPEEPPMYRCVLLNDDFTPMDFVVQLLVQLFHHPHAAANRIMLDVHTKGRGVAGVYTREVAETKATQALSLADKHSHPLQVTIERE